MTLEDRLRASLATRLGDDPEGVEEALAGVLARRRAWFTGTLKTCSSCGESKSSAHFHIDSRERDGIRRVCIVCRAIEQSA